MTAKIQYSRITEQRNPNSKNIDKMSIEEIINVINNEDKKVIDSIKNEIPVIKQTIEKIVERMQQGGRLLYVGSGTSGRVGVLDAVECVPTFNVSPDKVIGVLAGGKEAMFLAQENLEDKARLGIKDMQKYNVAETDVVVGITASGDTSYVIGAIDEAKRRGALTVGIACNKNSSLEQNVDYAITPVVGPEVITGSTRMKSGTAQKLILNMISTTVMIKMGKVYSNLMVDLKASNNKLRERARTIFTTITDSSEQIAEEYLKKTDYDVKASIIMYKNNVSFQTAKDQLKENNGVLRKIIG